MSTPEDAQEVVWRLTKKYGYLREETMKKISELGAECFEEVEEYRRTMDEAVSRTIET